MLKEDAEYSSTIDAGLAVPLSLSVSTPRARREGSVRVLIAERPAEVGADVDSYDTCLTTAPCPPHPWVQVEDVRVALDGIQAAFRRSPLATVCAARLLRTRHASIEDALFTESLALSSLLGARNSGGGSPSGPRHGISRRERLTSPTNARTITSR